MTAAFPLGFRPYGAAELRLAAKPAMARALALSSLIGVVAFLLGWSASRFISVPPPAPDHRRPVDLFQAPLPVVNPRTPSPPASGPPVRIARSGVPVPVAEPTVAPEVILNPGDVGQETPGVQPGAAPQAPPREGNGEEGAVNDPGAPIFVDRLPEPIRRVEPTYPPFARDAGVQGLVVVHVLVGKEGKVEDVRVDPRHSVPLLDSAAIEAGREWTFQPGLVDDRPVKVWVGLSFRFTLR